jgi:hypothetical protein
MNFSKWQLLLNGLNVSRKNNFPEQDQMFPIAESEILDAESQLNIVLPSDYKFYCNLFGWGDFRELRILCISYEYLRCKGFGSDFGDVGIVEEWGDNLDLFDDVNIYHEVSRLVTTGFLFGLLPGGMSLYFDLSSYNVNDKSCDIVAIDFKGGHPWEVFKIGRNFCDFIQNYALWEDPSCIHKDLIWRIFRSKFTPFSPSPEPEQS